MDEGELRCSFKFEKIERRRINGDKVSAAERGNKTAKSWSARRVQRGLGAVCADPWIASSRPS